MSDKDQIAVVRTKIAECEQRLSDDIRRIQDRAHLEIAALVKATEAELFPARLFLHLMMENSQSKLSGSHLDVGSASSVDAPQPKTSKRKKDSSKGVRKSTAPKPPPQKNSSVWTLLKIVADHGEPLDFGEADAAVVEAGVTLSAAQKARYAAQKSGYISKTDRLIALTTAGKKLLQTDSGREPPQDT